MQTRPFDLSKYAKDFLVTPFAIHISRLINEEAERNELFKHQLTTIFENGVTLSFTENLADRPDSFATFHSATKVLTLVSEKLRGESHESIVGILRHEVLHAYKTCIHEMRAKKSHPGDLAPEHFANAARHGHGFAYFPYTEKEAQDFQTRLLQGKQRILDFQSLLQKKESDLSPAERMTLTKYMSAAKKYSAELIIVDFKRAKPDDPLFQRDVAHQICQGQISAWVDIIFEGVSVQFEVIKVLEMKDDCVKAQGYYHANDKDYDRALIYRILRLNKEVEYIDIKQCHQRNSELDAHIMGDFHPAIGECFYPEMKKYDEEDAKVAFSKKIEAHDFEEAKPVAVGDPATNKLQESIWSFFQKRKYSQPPPCEGSLLNKNGVDLRFPLGRKNSARDLTMFLRHQKFNAVKHREKSEWVVRIKN